MMTSLSVTRESERGTLEALLSTPVEPIEVMIGKLAPYVMVGLIQTVIIYASQAKEYGLEGAAIGLGVIIAVSLATLVSFLFTPLIGRLLGRIGMSIIVRVLGLILCAMAVQFVLIGMADATDGLILRSAAAPYAH
jgi:multiple antibiotic resistance protein